VRAWEEEIIIPTYLVGPANVNPMFYNGRAYQGAKGRVYPYPLLDKLTDEKKDVAYKAVYLENRYVKICVLPEIGGRIFSALDKTNGHDFFYRQHVIKPALIGMLGAWASGGVEWNFPHHHRPTSFMKVHHTVTQNKDGGSTVWVGETELRHRMKWITGLTLRPGSSCIEVTIKLFNRTPIQHSFLCWANVAVHATQQYQVIFPPDTEYVTYHGKNQFACWPVSHELYYRVDFTRGVDVSLWKNHPSSTSMFAWNSKGNFTAGYDHKKEGGVVFTADHHTSPGKKFWTWGTGDTGRMWEKKLTDSDGPYLEIMVGAFSDNQPDYSWIGPFETKSVTQHWYPIRRIGGVKSANRNAAVNLEFAGNSTALLGFNTTSAHENAKIALEDAQGRAIFAVTTDISPEEPFVEEVPLPSGIAKENIRAVLYSAEGEVLVSYTHTTKERGPMPEPAAPPPPPEEIETVEELYLAGLRLDQFHNPAMEPRPYYEEALRRDPGHSKTNTALGIRCYDQGLLDEAERMFGLAAKRLAANHTRPRDGEPLYYLGAVQKTMGKNDEACDALNRAAWDHAFRAPAHHLLAEIACLKGEYRVALDHIERSLQANASDTRAMDVKAAILNRLGMHSQAKKQAMKTLSIDPLDYIALNEKQLANANMAPGMNSAPKGTGALNAAMGDDVQAFLEAACDYMSCGMRQKAAGVLLECINYRKKNSLAASPLPHYFLGYLFEKNGMHEQALKSYRTASSLPPGICFPFRLESAEVLRFAAAAMPDDPRPHYYLGNLLFDAQPEKAMKEWERAKALGSTLATVHRNLGLAHERVENDITKAVDALERAVEQDPGDARLFFELDLLLEKAGVLPEKRLARLEANHRVVAERDDALCREIMLLIRCGHYGKAADLLAGHHFHKWEGVGQVHSLYVNAHLLNGMQLLDRDKHAEAIEEFEAAWNYPENLEKGKPKHRPTAPKIHYLTGLAERAGHAQEKALSCFKLAADAEGVSPGSEGSFYQGLALCELGQRKEAEELFDSLIRIGKERIDTVTDASVDFFTKFGSKRSQRIKRARAHYIMGLGHLGRGDRAKAKSEFEKALELDINHTWTAARLAKMREQQKQ